MVTAPASVEAILARMRVPGEHGLFVLGCFERPATLYMQQVRALNLIYALTSEKRGAETSLIVIGAGAGGLTAAAAAAMLGWRVTMLEKNGGDVLSLAGSIASKRWLHPHIYEWPADATEQPSTKLGVLDWEAGPADKVIEQLRHSWKLIERSRGVETHLGVRDVSIESLDGGYLVQWNGGGARVNTTGSLLWGDRAGTRFRTRRADLVVLAVGFGKEEPTEAFPNVTSYWENDNIDQFRDGAMHPPLVLISGTGDGGLIDVLRYSFSNFKHEQVLDQLRAWLGEAVLANVKRELLAIEQAASATRSQRKPYEPALNHAYRELVDALHLPDPAKSPLPLRTDVSVVLTGTSRFPLTLESAPINRFLFSLTNAQYIPGPLDRVALNGKQWDVWFHGEREPRQFAEVLVRHGPTSSLKRSFPNIFDRCQPLRDAVAAGGRDPTRDPCFDQAYSVLLTTRSAALQPGGGAAERDVALKQAVWVSTPSEALNAYRARLTGEFAATGDSIGAATRPVDASWLRDGASVRLIHGLPGTGKSALVRFLIAELARDASVVPLYIHGHTVRTAPDGSFFVTAIDWNLASADEADRAALRDLWLQHALQGRLIVFLDGVDEIIDETARKGTWSSIAADVANLRRGNRVVVTSRSTGDVPSGLHVEALELRRSIFRFDHDLQAAWRALAPPNSGELANVSITPVGSGLEQRVHSLDRMIDALIQSNDPRVLVALGELALATVSTTRFTRDAITQACERAGQAGAEVEADELLGSLLIVPEQGDGLFAFQHRIIHERLAAHALARRGVPAAIALALDDAALEHEILPRAVAHATGDDCFAVLDALPESVDFMMLRLRVRTTRHRPPQSHDATQIADDIQRLIKDPQLASDTIVQQLGNACSGIAPEMSEFVRDRLAAIVRASDPIARRRAVEFLEHASLGGSLELLAPLLQAAEDDVRQAAARALGALGDPSAIPALRAAYLIGQLRSGLVFTGAVDAIAHIGGQAAVETLVEILRDRGLYTNLRWPAARHLGRLADRRGLAPLLEACSDVAVIIRATAVAALGAFHDPRVPITLATCLNDPEVSVRMDAAERLVELADHAQIPVLLQALGDSHPSVKAGAARALLRLDREALLARLRPMIADGRDSWRGHAVEVVAEALGENALEMLLRLSQDRDERLRWGATRALARLTSSDVSARLVELADDLSDDVRYAAVEGLGQRLEIGAVEQVAQRSRVDAENEVGFAALDALGKLGGPVAEAALTEAIQRGHFVASCAVGPLVAVAKEAAIPILAAAWRAHDNSEPHRFRRHFTNGIAQVDADAAATMLRELVASADAISRRDLAYAFGRMTRPSAVPGLLLLLGDGDDGVQRAARWNLQKLPPAQVRDGIVLARHDGHPVVESHAAQFWPFYGVEAEAVS